MNMIRGTITNPNQATMISGIKANIKEKIPIKKNGIPTTVKATITNKVIIAANIILIINPMTGQSVKTFDVRKHTNAMIKTAT